MQLSSILCSYQSLSYSKGVFSYFCIRRIKWKWKHTPHLRFRWNFYFLQVGNFLYLFSNFKKVDYNKKHNLLKQKNSSCTLGGLWTLNWNSEQKNMKCLIKEWSENLFSGLLVFLETCLKCLTYESTRYLKA